MRRGGICAPLAVYGIPPKSLKKRNVHFSCFGRIKFNKLRFSRTCRAGYFPPVL